MQESHEKEENRFNKLTRLPELVQINIPNSFSKKAKLLHNMGSRIKQGPRAQQGGRGKPSPQEPKKIVVEKWCYFRRLYFQDRRPQGGNTGNVPPPEIEKMLQKTGVIQKGSIFSNNFSKSHSKFNFSIESLSKIFKIFSKFPKNLCFSSKRAKNNTWFVKFF